MTKFDRMMLRLSRDLRYRVPPISPDWVALNCKDSHETAQLCDQLANVLRGYAQAPQELRMFILACAQQNQPVPDVRPEPSKGNSD